MNPGKREEKKVLLVPAVNPGYGTGHLKRSLFLLNKLGDHTYLYIPADITQINELHLLLKGNKNIIRHLDMNEKWDMVILDKRATGRKEFGKFCSTGTVLGLDEGGGCRKEFPYLVDTLLNPLQKIKPNIVAALYRNNRIKRKDHSNSFKQVLISFGGEDTHHLSITLVRALISRNIFPPGELTIVEGPLFKQYQWPEGVAVKKNPPDVTELIPDYDLVFTHFGMTCFESIAKGVPVILFNPTSYHQKLGNFYHLPHIGIRKPCISKLKKILAHPDFLKKSLYKNYYVTGKYSFLPDLIQSMHPGGNTDCPVCRRTRNRVIQRFHYKTYFRCRSCGIIYFQGFKHIQEKYDKNYFVYEYKKQYGRTYLEDFNTIKEFAHKRLAFIKKITGGKKSLLDIGCAYGPFLAAAKEEGFAAEGMDISPDASTYVNKELNINCRCMDFSGITGKQTGNKKYDIITMWFVLEHFHETDRVLKKVNKYMKMGGIFAFSTPNISGISYKKNKKTYLENNPEDHYTLWNPVTAGKVLKLYGFKIEKIRITGHHPERFPFMKKKKGKKNKKNIFFYFLFFISRIFNLGDTFEVYARKVQHQL